MLFNCNLDKNAVAVNNSVYDHITYDGLSGLYKLKGECNMTIFYFTGTGNSLFAARKIAESTGANLISIPQVIHEQKSYTDDCIGFVYPQYANGLPKMVRKFISGNTFEADYFFAVNLWSFIHFKALGEIASLLPLNYGVYLKTPMNFILLLNSPKNPINMMKKADKRLDGIINDINKRKEKHTRPKKGIGNATKYFGESKFMLMPSCIKCGTCAKVCPANNIIVLNDMVTFENKCETCYACVNLCPAHAIYSSKATLKRRQYRNPLVSTAEIAEANTRNE